MFSLPKHSRPLINNPRPTSESNHVQNSQLCLSGSGSAPGLLLWGSSLEVAVTVQCASWDSACPAATPGHRVWSLWETLIYFSFFFSSPPFLFNKMRRSGSQTPPLSRVLIKSMCLCMCMHVYASVMCSWLASGRDRQPTYITTLHLNSTSLHGHLFA